MTDESNHINHFTAEDIRRYLANEMTEQEMHAIEKAALEDPFLADAIDGMKEAFESHGEQQVMFELGNLKNQLSEKSQNKKVVPMTFGWAKWAAAAVVLFIAGSTYFIINVRKTREYAASFKAAKTEERPAAKEILADSTPALVLQPPPLNKSEAPAQNQQKNIEPASPAASKPAVSEGVAILERKGQALAARKKEAPQQSKQQPAASEISDNNDSMAADISAQVAGVSVEKKLSDSLRETVKTLQGKVVDPNGNPLSNVRIEAMKTNQAILSDSNGNFALRSKEPISEVNISAVGYQNANYRISESANNQLILNPSNATLNEVVVTGYSKGKIRPAIEKSEGEAVPSVGWEEYNKYLQQSRKFPSSNSNITSYVIVSFNVYGDGTTGKFKIEQPITEIYNREAIRLIKEGPSWKLVSGKKARVRLQVIF